MLEKDEPPVDSTARQFMVAITSREISAAEALRGRNVENQAELVGAGARSSGVTKHRLS